MTENAIEKSIREQNERRDVVVRAVADLSQASIDLLLVDVSEDVEKRSVSYWLANHLMLGHKYEERLIKYRREREENRKRAENQTLFDKYAAINPIKSAEEYLMLLQRFNLAPKVQFAQASAEKKAA